MTYVDEEWKGKNAGILGHTRHPSSGHSNLWLMKSSEYITGPALLLSRETKNEQDLSHSMRVQLQHCKACMYSYGAYACAQVLSQHSVIAFPVDRVSTKGVVLCRRSCRTSASLSMTDLSICRGQCREAMPEVALTPLSHRHCQGCVSRAF